MLAGCSSKSEKSDDPQAKATEAPAVSEKQAPPIDPRFLPLEALAEMETVPLETEAPCSELVRASEPALKAIAETRASLAEDKSHTSAPAILSDLSKNLSDAAREAPEDLADDLGRVHSELRAAFLDLAESASLLATALRQGDKGAARQQKARIDNGVANLKTSLQQLTSLCHP
jgi:hypothetical protein